MSGNSSGGSDGDDWRPSSTASKTGGAGTTGSGGAEEQNPCMFTEIAILASPNAQVIDTLAVGAELIVSLQETPSRVVATSNGMIAGSITSARLADIIECIRSGQRYQARVIQIAGGAVTVEIYPV